MAYDPIDAFFVTKVKGGMADVALLTNTSAVTKEIAVIFDREGSLMNIGNAIIQSAKPSCVIMTKDLPNAESETNATIIINSVSYKIKDPQTDADGTTTLTLSID